MKRNTIQRALTLEAVKNFHGHPTADEVYEEVSLLHPTISRGTVYRNLNQLAESGEIAVRELQGGAIRFDSRTGEHYHAKCLKCGRLFDVDMEILPDLTDRIRDSHGFQFSGHDIIFKGVCEECRK